jgi:hypothetical protein
MDSDVVGEVKRGSVDPQWPTQPQPGPVEELSEPGDQVQSRLDPLPNHIDPDATIAVEQAGAIEDGEPADVARPAIVVPHQQEQVRRGQPFQTMCLDRHGYTAAVVPSP